MKATMLQRSLQKTISSFFVGLQCITIYLCLERHGKIKKLKDRKQYWALSIGILPYICFRNGKHIENIPAGRRSQFRTEDERIRFRHLRHIHHHFGSCNLHQHRRLHRWKHPGRNCLRQVSGNYCPLGAICSYGEFHQFSVSRNIDESLFTMLK